MTELVPGYDQLLKQLKVDIQTTQTRAVLAANSELIHLYWRIGHQILQQQEEQGWGANVIDKLAQDLNKSFPDSKGWSGRNLRRMRVFARALGNDWSILPQAVAKLPWGHYDSLIAKTKSTEELEFYLQRAVENAWSRSELERQISNQLHLHEGKGQTNFQKTLTSGDAVQAQTIIKDEYVFDFVASKHQMLERELEDRLVSQIEHVMRELGEGFAFVGRQQRMEAIDDSTEDVEEFYIDLLFFQITQQRYVVVELKIDKFKPKYAGQLNMYVAMVDDQIKKDWMNPTIGVLWCTDKNAQTVEYSLSNMGKPLGVAKYQTGQWQVTPALETESNGLSVEMLQAVGETIIEAKIIDENE